MLRSQTRGKQKTKEYPYQDLSLENIPGEIWKPVEGYEDYYKVSNKGRIKALAKYTEFDIPGRHTVRYWRDEKILKQGKKKTWNNTVKEYTYHLSVTFCVAQQMDSHSVSRLVYHTFIDKINFKRDEQYVIHIDEEHFNNRANNLQLSGRSDMGKQSYIKKRAISAFKGMDMTPFLAKRSESHQKAITQYDLKGKRLMVYDSVKAASGATGIYSSNISIAAKGKKLDMGGYIWRYGRGALTIDVSAYHKSKQAIKQKMCKIVSQYNMQGKRLNIFQSIADAAKSTNTIASAIQCAVAGRYSTAGGFIWQYGEGDKKIDVSGYRTRIQKMKLVWAKPVARYTVNGKSKKVYESIADAARDMGCSDDSISRGASNPDIVFRGYKWRFL
ncbi:MAG TPA: NUMOD1 domain-containing DNA-binding protein [Puia sp.]|nr:NUMOD1 domain-containing DNA-binding protein [Puia sp.]